MSYDKERAIAAQNSATAAATILSGTGAPVEVFEQYRQSIFRGTLDLAGIESVVVAFEGPSYSDPAPSAVSAPQVVESYAPQPTAARPHNDFVVNSGKHKGKTFSAIYASDPGWFDWAKDNLNNDYVRSRVVEFLAA